MTTAEEAQYLYLTTTGWKSGRKHEIEIWFVQYNGRYYLMAEHGEAAHWVKNIRQQAAVSFRVGDAHFTGTAEIINVDHPDHAQISPPVGALMDAKYQWRGQFIVQLTAQA
jgi:deazaflavin-dependent oxidoreductase (nitroreductase family)